MPFTILRPRADKPWTTGYGMWLKLEVGGRDLRIFFCKLWTEKVNEVVGTGSEEWRD